MGPPAWKMKPTKETAAAAAPEHEKNVENGHELITVSIVKKLLFHK